jgi:hypothetical protein
VFETGRQFKMVARNTIQRFVRHRYCLPQQESVEGNLFFDGPSFFIRAEENLYCIGQQ